MNSYCRCILSHTITTTNASVNTHEHLLFKFLYISTMNYLSHLSQTQIFRCYCTLSKCFVVYVRLYFATFILIIYSFHPHPLPRGSTLGPLTSHPSINSKFSQHLFLHFSILPSLFFDDILYLLFSCCYVLYCFLVSHRFPILSCLSNLILSSRIRRT